MRRIGSLKLLAVVLIACIGAGGLIAATGAAKPAVQTAANLASNVKKALKLGKSADRKAGKALSTARRAEKRAAAGKQGPAGAAGAQGERGTQASAGLTGQAGATGATGPQGATGLWDVFEATSIGVVHRRGTGSGEGRLSTGVFYVSFAPNDISGCAYVASVGSVTDGTPPALYATVEQRTGQATDLRLRAFNDAGAPIDPGAGNGFHVAVLCP